MKMEVSESSEEKINSFVDDVMRAKTEMLRE